MRIWNQTLKRTILAMFAIVIAFTWTQTGFTQAPCLVGRGLDPLDVVNSGPRHNVWIVLDSSGSMNGPFAGAAVGTCDARTGIGDGCKINVAKKVIKNLMATLVDGAGRPLVNWGFVHYDPTLDTSLDRCVRPDAPDDLDTYPDQPRGCFGLQDASFVAPNLCGGDSRGAVNAVLDGVTPASITPIGVALTDIAEYLVGRHRPDDPLVTPNTTDFVAGLLPGQKNFIIQVTDGRDTCECNQGSYPPVFGDPLLTPVSMRPDPVDPMVLVPSIAGDDFASFNAGLKGEIALQNIDPALDESKGNIFVIGMDIRSLADRQRINTIAWMASGARLPGRDPKLMNAAFFADDAAGVVAQFENILSRVGTPASTLSLGASSVASVKEVIATFTNTAVSALDVIPPLSADAGDFREAREIRAAHRNNVRFTTSVEVPGFRGHLTATNIYKVARQPGDTSTAPLNPRSDRVADFTEMWDAGVELQDDNPDARPMFFNKRGTTGVIAFNVANVTAADLGVTMGYLSELDGVGAKSANDARDIVVQVTRGYRLSVDPTSVPPSIYKPDGTTLNFSAFNEDGTATWKLYENLSGSVAVVTNPPRSPDFDPPLNHGQKYGVGGSEPGDGFYWDHINRRTVVYYPSNFGILHGFDAQFGTELVAFIPDDVVGLAPGEIVGSRDTLKDVVALVVKENNGVINHKFTLAGPPIADDAFLRATVNDWRSLVVFGRGRGGRFLTALDVTTVPTTPSSLGLLWNRGNREGLAEGQFDGLGETWSAPLLGNVSVSSVASPDDNDVDQWLVFAGGGYGCDNAENEGQHLFAFTAEDGSIYYRGSVSDDPASAIPYNALPARATLFNPHEEDVTDFNDRVTRVYIPDVQGNVWKLDTSPLDPATWTLGVFAEMGGDQPITAPVTLLNDVFDPNQVFVMTGSGGDRRAAVPPGGFKFRTWIDTDPQGANTLQYPEGAAVTFEQAFLDGERQSEQAVTAGQLGDPLPALVFFVASEGDLDLAACVVTFRSTLYAFGVETGQSDFDLDSTQLGLTSTDLGEGKAFLFARDGNVYVTKSGGLGVSAEVSVWGDGEFDAPPAPGGYDGFTVAVRVDGFRISPF